MDEDKEADFEGKARCCGGINGLGKAGGQAAEAGFDAVVEVPDKEGTRRGMRAPAVLLAGRVLLAAGGFFEYIFVGVVGVARVGVGADSLWGQKFTANI